MIKINPKLKKKFYEALNAVLPIIAIVLILCFTVAPITPSILLCFLLGALMIMVGMMFFTLGAEMSMSIMGEKVGAAITKSKNVPIIVILAFILGFIITISEPDLQVLAQQVPSIPNITIILAVAVGVGVFLVIALLRMLFNIGLSKLLIVFYIIAFGILFIVPESFRAVAFDSGGVTTGPMTVPFIMALGIGISAIRNDQNAADDSFGLVALCSIGPILAVLILGMIYVPEGSIVEATSIPEIQDSVELWNLFASGLPKYIEEIAFSLTPIIIFFGIFQLFVLKLHKKSLMKIELLQIVRTAQKGLYVGKYEVLSGEASRKRRLSGF